MKHILSKPLKTGDIVGIVYTNSIWLAFYCDCLKGNHFWNPWTIICEDEAVDKGLRKAFKPARGYVGAHSEKRMIKIDFEDIDPSHPQHSYLQRAIEVLRKRKIITY